MINKSNIIIGPSRDVIGSSAGEKLHHSSTYNIIIGTTGPRVKDSIENYRLWIDIGETDRPLIGADFKARTVTISGGLFVTGNIDISGDSTFGGSVTFTGSVSGVDHSALSNLSYATAGHTGFEATLSANQKIDHSSISVLAGTGMSGGGTINGSVTLNCDITQYTDALARQSISEIITGIDYNNSTGIFSMTAGYGIPTTTQLSNADNAILKDGTVQFTANYNIGTNNLGINTATPRRKFDVLDASNPQLRFSQADDSKYAEWQVDASNIVYLKIPSSVKLMEISHETTGRNTRIGGFTNYYGGAGTGNTAIGYATMQYNSGSDNTVIGSGAGSALTGIRNIAIGISAGAALTGGYNVLLGYQTGSAMVYSNYNLMIGSALGRGMVSVDNNIIIGNTSGNALTGGDYNVYIGNNTDYIQPAGTMTATLQAGGSLDTGYHFYIVSFVVDGVETAPSKGYALGAPYVNATAGNQTAYLQVIPTYTGPGNCTARKIYRTKKYPGNSLFNFYYVGTISDNTTTTYTDTIADSSLGGIYSANPTGSILIGSYSKAEKGNSFVAGSETSPINRVYFGEGVYSTTPSDTTIYATGGWGTDIAGADLIMQAGIATGNAEGGDYLVKTSDVGSSSIAGQTPTTKFGVYSKGNVVVGKQAAVATDATDGFLYIPSGNGVPVGTPTAYTGKVAMYYDTANEDLYIYNGGWVKITLS